VIIMEKYEYGNTDAPVVLIQPADEHMLGAIHKEIDLINDKAALEYLLVVFKVDDWNGDLSPWPAPAVFGKEGYDGRAEETLTEILNYCRDDNKTYLIGGYSLAGLFALWASTRTDVFKGVAAASPSVWFPGFDVYINDNRIKADRVYLSLGDKEEKTKNPVMATVGDRIRGTYELLKSEGINCTLEWNEGSHFKDATIRTARAFAWIINTLRE